MNVDACLEHHVELARLRRRVARLEGVLAAIRANAHRGHDVTLDIIDVCTRELDDRFVVGQDSRP